MLKHVCCHQGPKASSRAPAATRHPCQVFEGLQHVSGLRLQVDCAYSTSVPAGVRPLSHAGFD